MSVTRAYQIALVVVLFLVVFELVQAGYFMVADRKKPGSRRTAWALTRRVGLSILLIVLIVVGIRTGILHPHGVYVP
ncbi:MAG TPA: DUF2909 domain-containing protein [Nevskiaceae bacterium]